MKRVLLTTRAFERTAAKCIRKNPSLVAELQATLDLLSEDSFASTLKTHKLKGKLAGSWACSAGYDLRIVFEFVEHQGRSAILLQAAGTHEDVY